MKNCWAVLEKSNIEVSLLMHVLGYILPWTTIFCFGYFIMFKQLFVHFHKDTFNFVPPMFYVGIWRSHHIMRGATVFWGGHRWPGGPPVASDEKRHPCIYIYINWLSACNGDISHKPNRQNIDKGITSVAHEIASKVIFISVDMNLCPETQLMLSGADFCLITKPDSLYTGTQKWRISAGGF